MMMQITMCVIHRADSEIGNREIILGYVQTYTYDVQCTCLWNE